MRLGYASLVKDLPQANFKTLRLNNYSEERLKDVIAHNLNSLDQIVDYNIEHGINMFRISSSLIPFGSHPINTLDWQKEFKDEFKGISDKLREHDIRFSVHPGQYTVLNSLNEEVVKKSILELDYHVKVLESVGGSQENKMILHIGGVYGDKGAAMMRFIDVAKNRLSKGIKKHLVLENDERSYTAKEVLFIAQATSLPMVFDNLHHQINPSLENLSDLDWIEKVEETWTLKDGNQKIHYSQQDPGKRPGGHSETINLALFNDFYQGVHADIMLEVKDKNRSVLKTKLLLHPNQKELKGEWARYKYLIMSKSYAHYSEIRKLFSGNPRVDVLEFYKLVDEALALPNSLTQERVALEHIWGYFKKTTDQKSKDKFFLLLEKFKKEEISSKRLKTYLYKLSEKSNQSYLLNAYYFND